MGKKRSLAIAKEEMMNFGGPQPQPSRKKFIGVRQRQTGGWVAEIKNTQRTRIWLGTFKTAEGAARAYDEAACSLRGANAITNFSPSSQTLSTKPAVPSKITNLLLRRHEAQHNAPLPPTLVTRHAHVAKPSDTYLTDYLCDLDADLPLNDTMACDIDSNMIMSFEARTGVDVDCCSGGGTREEDKEEENKENLGFRFIDEVGSGHGFSPFDIVEETEFAREDKEPLTISEAVKMMKYNRKFSVNVKIPQANVVSEMDTSNDADSICVVELA